jgi:hypothetical protein
VIGDDYGSIESCRRPPPPRGITEWIQRIDWTGVCWRRDRD